MADNSWEIDSFMDFEACDVPRGMTDYVLNDLTKEQKIKLENYKINKLRTDQTYVAQHPEIRGLIIMILRTLMRTRPTHNIYEAVGKYFTKPSVDIKEEIYAYIEQREEILGANSTILLKRDNGSGTSLSEEQKLPYLDEGLSPSSIKRNEQEKKLSEYYTNVRWGSLTETSKEIFKICNDLLEELLGKVVEKVEDFSMASSYLASDGLPVDYDDPAYELDSEKSFD